MADINHNSAPTRTIDAGGVTYSYRRFGKPGAVPLVFLQHFTGNLDNWDPALTDGLGEDREIILFNNRGVATSSGSTPATVAEMAQDAASFIDALGLKTIDVFGFSLGGMIGQQLLLDRPEMVRKAILIGTGPRGGEGMKTFTPEVWEMFGRAYAIPDEIWLEAFFTPTERSQKAGHAFLDRIRSRKEGRDVSTTGETAQAQLAAVAEWGAPTEGSYAYLKSIKHPVLVVNGHNDIIIPSINSYILQQELPNAQLLLYPDSNHGAQYHNPASFVAQARAFLNTDW